MTNEPGRFGTLTCPDCGANDVPKTGGRQIRCPDCQAIETKRQKRENYLRTAEHQKEQRRARYQENRLGELAYHRARKYGISPYALAGLIAEQGGKCPVCAEPVRIEEVSLDHGHDTGVVRGALHSGCNTAIGLLRDDPVRCDRAAAYLRRPSTSDLRVQAPELLSVPRTTCVRCGRTSTRRFRQMADGSWHCFDGTRCRRRAVRQARGDSKRGRPRFAATV